MTRRRRQLTDVTWVRLDIRHHHALLADVCVGTHPSPRLRSDGHACGPASIWSEDEVRLTGWADVEPAPVDYRGGPALEQPVERRAEV